MKIKTNKLMHYEQLKGHRDLFGKRFPDNDCPQLQLMKAIEELKTLSKPSIHPEPVMAFYSLFEQHGSIIYKFANEFSECLKQAPLNIEHKHIPLTKNIFCIEFPKPFKADGSYIYRCAYVMVAPIENHKILNVVLPIFEEDGRVENYFMSDYGVITFREGETLDGAFENFMEESTSEPAREVYEFILKALIYINSGDPDLRDFKPSPKPSNQKKLKKWRRLNESTVPVTLVGFDWKKPRNFNTSESLVSGHWRWQPYGPMRTKVKLIWISEHKRQYCSTEGSNHENN